MISLDKHTFFVNEIDSNQEIKNFFTDVLVEFGNEIKAVSGAFFNYGKDSADDLFEQIERCFLGIFNNAIVKKCSNVVILQEYTVWNKHIKNIGRADYLVRHTIGGRPVNFLFEAKKDIFDGKKYSRNQIDTYFRPVFRQARKYYNAEKEFFKGETTYLVALIFERVKSVNHLAKLKEWGHAADNLDFYGLYKSDTAGLMVYGKLRKAN